MMLLKPRLSSLMSDPPRGNGWFSGKIDSVAYLVENGIPVPQPCLQSNRRGLTLASSWQNLCDNQGKPTLHYRASFDASGAAGDDVFVRLCVPSSPVAARLSLNGKRVGHIVESALPQYIDLSSLDEGENLLECESRLPPRDDWFIDFLVGERYVLKISAGMARSAQGRDGIEVSVLTAGYESSFSRERRVRSGSLSDEMDDRVEIELSAPGMKALQARLRSTSPEQPLVDPVTGEVHGSVRSWRGRLEGEGIHLWSPEEPWVYSLGVLFYTTGRREPESTTYSLALGSCVLDGSDWLVNGEVVDYGLPGPESAYESATLLNSEEIRTQRSAGRKFMPLRGFPRDQGVLQTALEKGMLLGIACESGFCDASDSARRNSVAAIAGNFGKMIETLGTNPAVAFWKLCSRGKASSLSRKDRLSLEAVQRALRFFDPRRSVIM